MKKVIHLGDAGAGRLKCGARPIGEFPADLGSNWTWKREETTCKKCLVARELIWGI